MLASAVFRAKSLSGGSQRLQRVGDAEKQFVDLNLKLLPCSITTQENRQLLTKTRLLETSSNIYAQAPSCNKEELLHHNTYLNEIVVAGSDFFASLIYQNPETTATDYVLASSLFAINKVIKLGSAHHQIIIKIFFFFV